MLSKVKLGRGEDLERSLSHILTKKQWSDREQKKDCFLLVPPASTSKTDSRTTPFMFHISVKVEEVFHASYMVFSENGTQQAARPSLHSSAQPLWRAWLH